MTTETLVILSNVGVCGVSIALAFVTFMAISREDRKFLLSVLTTVVTLGVATKKRQRKSSVSQVPAEHHSALVIAESVPESDRERFLRAVK